MNANQECDGPRDPCKFSVLVDTGTEDSVRLYLFETWLSLWCQRNCSGNWDVTQQLDRTKDYQLILRFSEAREAVHFKLASGALHVTERSAVSAFMIH